MNPNVTTNDPEISEPVRNDLIPKLLWPSYSYETNSFEDSNRIPDRQAIQFRHGNWDGDSKLRGSTDFWLSAYFAETILIMDPQMDEQSGYDFIEHLKHCGNLKVLKIMKGSQGSLDLEGHFQKFREEKQSKKIIGHFYLKQTLDKRTYPFLHDRLACIDGELWHFGATVGGLHKGLNAFSRGWNAKSHEFINWFEQVWE